MKKYITYSKKLFKLNLAYGANFFFTQILDLVFFLSFFFLWKSVYSSSGNEIISGYTLSALITYYFATEFIFRFDVIGSIYLNEGIWHGDLTNWLIKPISVTIINIIEPVIEKTMVVTLAFPTLIISYLVAKDYIIFPSLVNFGLFFATLLLAFILNIVFNLCIHALCFKYGDQENNIELINYIAWFLAGGFFPLTFISGFWGNILNLLPLKYLMYVPANVFLGKFSTQEILLGWLSMIIWIIVFYIFFKRIYNHGLKYYTGVGR